MIYTGCYFQNPHKMTEEYNFSGHALVLLPRCTWNGCGEKLFITAGSWVSFSKFTWDSSRNNFLWHTLWCYSQNARQMGAENEYSWWPIIGCYSQNTHQVAGKNRFLWWHTPGCDFQNAHEIAAENNFMTCTYVFLTRCTQNGNWEKLHSNRSFSFLHIEHLAQQAFEFSFNMLIR